MKNPHLHEGAIILKNPQYSPLRCSQDAPQSGMRIEHGSGKRKDESQKIIVFAKKVHINYKR